MTLTVYPVVSRLYCSLMSIKSRIGRALLVAGILGMTTGICQAQQRGTTSSTQNRAPAAQVNPPKPGQLEPPNRVLVYGVALIVGAVAVGLAVMPSRRTHAD